MKLKVFLGHRTPDNPAGALRVEALGLTDALLFDYQVLHRGGPNDSDDLRSLLYLTYARPWYKDHNFRPRSTVQKTVDTDFVVGNGFTPLSDKRKGTFARIMEAGRFARPEPGPAEPDPFDYPPPLERITRPFAYDPTAPDAAVQHELWRASFAAPPAAAGTASAWDVLGDAFVPWT